MKLTRIFLALFVLLTLYTGNVFAKTNELVYNGYATDLSSTAMTGTHDIDLKLYTVSASGDAIWTESQADVEFNSGFFTVTLGNDDANPLPDFGDYLYLGVTIDPSDGGTELSPRSEFYASARALVADTANSLGDDVLETAMSWTGAQTFSDVVIENLTVASCTGCGGGGDVTYTKISITTPSLADGEYHDEQVDFGYTRGLIDYSRLEKTVGGNASVSVRIYEGDPASGGVLKFAIYGNSYSGKMWPSSGPQVFEGNSVEVSGSSISVPLGFYIADPWIRIKNEDYSTSSGTFTLDMWTREITDPS